MRAQRAKKCYIALPNLYAQRAIFIKGLCTLRAQRAETNAKALLNLRAQRAKMYAQALRLAIPPTTPTSCHNRSVAAGFPPLGRSERAQKQWFFQRFFDLGAPWVEARMGERGGGGGDGGWA